MFIRDMVRQKKITMEEGTLMRTLLFMPGGLELHIGVSQSLPTFHGLTSYSLHHRSSKANMCTRDLLLFCHMAEHFFFTGHT